MSCRYLHQNVKNRLSAINIRHLYRSYSAVANLNYNPPTHDEIAEYTQNIASVLLSWPTENREYFLSTLHKAQANPRRNNNYDQLLTNHVITNNQMKSLDYYKLQHWLPFVHVNDIVQIMDEMKDSAMLACINNDNNQMITYNGSNPHHQQKLDKIKTENYDKMV